MHTTTRIILATLVATMCTIMQAAPLSLDISSLSNAWAEAEISAYKCRSAFRDFGKAIVNANAEVTAKRAKLGTTVRVYLKQEMERAQNAGDIEKVLIFKTALESARGGEIKGDDEAIVRLRKSYEKQLVLADKTLLTSGLASARAFYAALDSQKAEVTKKGDITDAQKIIEFQKKVKEWVRTLQEHASQTADEPPVTTPQRTLPRQPVREVKPKEPEWQTVKVDSRAEDGVTMCSAKQGDVILISYVDGTWFCNSWAQWESPDDTSASDVNRCSVFSFLEGANQKDKTATLPPNTKVKPFQLKVEKDGVFALRTSDWMIGDNDGVVTYRFMHVPAGSSVPDLRNTPHISNVGGHVSNKTLSGTQREMTVTLSKTPMPHIVRNQYVVPQGCELVAEPGAVIVFEKGANLYAEGALKFCGAEKDPIVLKGKASGIGYWPGVIVQKSYETSFEWVRISGAKEGLRVVECSPTIVSTVFCGNEVGVHVGHGGPHPSFLNCVFAKNSRLGMDCHHGDITLDRCSFVDNGEFGAHIGYSGGAEASNCLVSGNKEGGLRFRDGGHGKFSNSSITGNKKVDVEAHAKCDFRENWWGISATRILQQKGDGANLPSIRDGRDDGSGDIVDVADFLVEPPKDCGSTVKW